MISRAYLLLAVGSFFSFICIMMLCGGIWSFFAPSELGYLKYSFSYFGYASAAGIFSSLFISKLKNEVKLKTYIALQLPTITSVIIFLGLMVVGALFTFS